MHPVSHSVGAVPGRAALAVALAMLALSAPSCKGWPWSGPADGEKAAGAGPSRAVVPAAAVEPCGGGLTDCGGICADLGSDAGNCGACGLSCGGGAQCERGACVPRYSLFFGDLHGHSGLSDGVGTPLEYFSYCRDVSGMDFCALTDHDVGPEALEKISEAADAVNSPAFVAFNGTEWSSTGYGHKVCIDITRPCSFASDDCDTPEELYDSVLLGGGLCFAAHPAARWPGAAPTDWSESEDFFEVAGEVYMSEDKMNEAWRDHRLKLGVVGVSDTHDGTPGSLGVTGCFAAELTRESILDALESRRCFATRARVNGSENPASLKLKVNGHWMGESVPAQAGLPLEISVEVEAPAIVKSITLKKNGRTIAVKEDCRARQCSWSHAETLDGPAYYYAVVSLGVNTLWSSPVFFE
jgi:hypothetical protein